MKVTIWHNPGCGSSRAALARLESLGHEIEIYQYLKERPSKKKITETLKLLGLKPSELLRPREPAAEELGLYNGASETRILTAMAENPRLIQRPIVSTRKGTVLARPPLRVDEVL
ncbi:MAG: ArsC/Spx/MgsR family protein [Hyphomonadaceae bacterium]